MEDEKNMGGSEIATVVNAEKPEAEDSGMEAGVTDEEDSLAKSPTSLELSVGRINGIIKMFNQKSCKGC